MTEPEQALIYRQKLMTRITHWLWVICLFFLLSSGLQIFNAHPTLYVGDQSGFDFDNSVLSIGAEGTRSDPKGVTTLLGHRFTTTGVLGLSYSNGNMEVRGFPAWATIPSHQDLATGRVVHFFFAWLLVFTFFAWLIASALSGHLWREIIPKRDDLRRLPADAWDHARLRFHHRASYNPMQKLTYAVILLLIFPMIILTGLSMSPGMNAFAPWLVEFFGGRQTARTLHFACMTILLTFFVVHILMVILAGPFNELRSIVTGWYRVGRSAEARSVTPPGSVTEG